MKLYKLSFENKAQWDGVKASFLDADENGNYPTKSIYSIQGMTIREVGHVPIDATYDEEGNELTPPSQHDDWAVDILTTEEISEVESYIIGAKANYYHGFMGVNAEIVQPKPSDSWLKLDIQGFLTAQGVEWTTSMTKAQLLNLINY